MSQLTLLPCLDSMVMAEFLRAELDVPRDLAKDLGRSAVEAVAGDRARVKRIQHSLISKNQ